jgi:hypothetical protein
MRLLASGSFLFAVGVFFLPWLDLRCEMGSQKMSLITQSGYEVAAGKYSEGEDLKKLQEQFGGGKQNDNNKKAGPNGEQGPKEAPVLYGFAGAAALGVLLCLVVQGKAWRAAAVVCALGALGVLGYQTATGFPMQDNVRQMEEQQKKQDEERKKLMANAKAPPQMQMFPDVKPVVAARYMIGFYLAWLLAALPAVFALADAMIAPAPKPRDYSAAADDDRYGKNPLE